MKLLKNLKSKITIVVAPHNPRKTNKLTFSFSFLIFIFVFWTGITVVVTYLTFSQLHYLNIKTKNVIVEKKFVALINKIKDTYRYLETVKTNEKQLYKILNIVEDVSDNNAVFGGPTLTDEKILDKILKDKILDLSIPELKYQLESLNNEINKHLEKIKKIKQNIRLQKQIYNSIPNMLPCPGDIKKISQNENFGYRIHPVTGEYEFHKGIDISGPYGSPIYATADGVVKYANWEGSYGNLVVIEHNYGYETRYGHLSKINVTPGEHVVRGKIIGLMGDTGRATCVHVHYEVRYNNEAINPVIFLDEDVYFTRGQKIK